MVEQKKAVFNALFEGTTDEICFDKKGGFYQQVKEVVTEKIELIDENEDEDDLSLVKDEEYEIIDEVENTEEDVLLIKEPKLKEKLSNESTKFKKEESLLSSNNLFKDVKVEISDGILKIEAKEESAKMMANMFKMMGSLFEASSKDNMNGKNERE